MQHESILGFQYQMKKNKYLIKWKVRSMENRWGYILWLVFTLNFYIQDKGLEENKDLDQGEDVFINIWIWKKRSSWRRNIFFTI